LRNSDRSKGELTGPALDRYTSFYGRVKAGQKRHLRIAIACKQSGFAATLYRGPMMRFAALLGVATAVLLIQANLPAQAGLIGNGTNTVSALFFLGASSVPAPPTQTRPRRKFKIT
jgi:hypothetical protein